MPNIDYHTLPDEEDVDVLLEDVETEDPPSKDDKPIYVSQLQTDQYAVEQIASHTSHPTRQTEAKKAYKFLLWDKYAETSKKVGQIKVGKHTYKPIESELIDKNSIYLPTGIEDYGSTGKLLKEIKEYLNFYFEVDPMMEKMLPNYVMFTWVFEKFPFIPYLQFVGLTGTGKTTAGETVASICYKAIDATGAASQSAIFRVADEWGGTLFLDEFDLKGMGSESYASMVSFLKSGVSDRAVLRVEANGKKFSVKPYRVKAPKIFTSENMISDAGLQSRTIIIRMKKNSRRLPLYRLQNYYKTGQSLRNKLLLWRLHNLPKIDLSKIEYGFEELSHLEGRVQQILSPIYYLSDKEGKKEIVEFAKEQESQTQNERRDTEEGSIFEIIYNYYENKKEQPTLQYVTDMINSQREELGYKTKRTERKMGDIVRNLLGFNIKRIGTEYKSTIMIEEDLEKYKHLIKYYGLASVYREVSEVSEVNHEKTSSDDEESVKSVERIFDGLTNDNN